MRLFYFLVVFSCLKVFVVSVPNISDSDVLDSFEIRKFLEFYNSEKLADSLGNLRDTVSPNCSEDLGLYVDALKNGEKWALKSK